mmetsp:Transcript_21620/g.30290  ORF Transcript_21620/g.30290 Transcript_21620/m.30290 type:complete len:842 (+) Transcript_21620:40-2565(+)
MGKQTGGNDNDNNVEQKLQAVLLADSFSTTFRPITLDPETPKVLCPLNNVTMLDHSIDFLAAAGVEELFVFCVSGGDAIEAYLDRSSSWTSTIKVRCVRDGSVKNAGDALRELDKRNLVQSDPFVLISGDVVTNVDVAPALKEHKMRHKKDSDSIMTVLLKQVGTWNVDPGYEHKSEDDARDGVCTYSASALRSIQDDLVVALCPADPLTYPNTSSRVLLYDSQPQNANSILPTSFFESHSRIDVRNDLLDTGIYICSPEVLARFSDEFDYLSIEKFLSNTVAEEEEGLQSKVHASVLRSHEYAARIHDLNTYHAISSDMLRRWCYPLVPDNLPSGYENTYRYELQRRMVYVEKKMGRTRIGRTSKISGPGMVGSHCHIGEHCILQKTIIGNHCNIANNTTIQSSHLWDNVTVESDATIVQSIICKDCIIKMGAVIPKGCIIASGCVIGENIRLEPFTRITLHQDLEEEDDFDDFDNASSSSSNSSNNSNSGDSNSDTSSTKTNLEQEKLSTLQENTDHNIVGMDGWGRMWVPPQSEYDDSDYSDSNSDDSDSECNHNTSAIRALNKMKSQSIGYDPTALFQTRTNLQLEDEDGLSDDEYNDQDQHNDYSNHENGSNFGSFQNNIHASSDVHGGHSFNHDHDGFLITGRQRGVDVVRELKTICLEHDLSNPIENLTIELNSFKFSQNATFGDCASGAILAIMERMDVISGMGPVKFVGAFKKELIHWKNLFEKLCHGTDEEMSILKSVEKVALEENSLGSVLRNEPSFRFVLQTLHDEEILSDETILSWAEIRKKEDIDSPENKLFYQKHTQEFLVWLTEASESSDNDSGDTSSSDESELE